MLHGAGDPGLRTPFGAPQHDASSCSAVIPIVGGTPRLQSWRATAFDSANPAVAKATQQPAVNVIKAAANPIVPPKMALKRRPYCCLVRLRKTYVRMPDS